jgi:hypothetical protein
MQLLALAPRLLKRRRRPLRRARITWVSGRYSLHQRKFRAWEKVKKKKIYAYLAGKQTPNTSLAQLARRLSLTPLLNLAAM